MRKKLWIAAAVFLADRVFKLLWEHIPPGGVVLIPGVLALRRAMNTGMAFSLFRGHPWLLGVLSVLIIGGAILYFRGKQVPARSAAGLMMMLGGAVGNMADRLLNRFVPDMFELLFVRFAIFNVADIFLVLGCGLTAIGFLHEEQKNPGEP